MKKEVFKNDLEELLAMGIISEKGYKKNIDEIEKRLYESIDKSKKIIKKNKKRLADNNKDFRLLLQVYLESNLSLISANFL